MMRILGLCIIRPHSGRIFAEALSSIPEIIPDSSIDFVGEEANGHFPINNNVTNMTMSRYCDGRTENDRGESEANK